MLSKMTSPTWVEIWEEAKLQCLLAGPLVVVNLTQMAFQLISIMFVGHLGELALSSASIAISVANVTGFSIMMGGAGGLETLCGQAFGANQHHLLGVYLQTGLVLLNALAILLSFVYGYMSDILAALGQDKLISQEAGRYARWLIPTLFAQASSQAIIRFLQSQSIVYPMMLCSSIAAACHVPLCWFLAYRTSMGFTGAALSSSICNWLNALVLYAYVMFAPSCEKSRSPLSLEAFHYMKSFVSLALPSAAMTCLEWWCYEILVLLSGLLPDPELQTSTLSICLNCSQITFLIPFGIGATVSTRLSNKLGAGDGEGARRVVGIGMSLSLSQACIVSILVLAFRHVLGHVFSGDHEVIESVAVILQLLAISSILDSIQAVLSGVARGCGWQALGAFINLGSFYVVALPVGACLGFLTSLNARGFWIGVICGPFVQSVMLGLLTLVADWEEEVEKAKRRVDLSSIRTPLLQ